MMREDKVNLFRRQGIYVPSDKWQLVNELSKIHPKDRAKFTRKNKNELYKIWFKINGLSEGR